MDPISKTAKAPASNTPSLAARATDALAKFDKVCDSTQSLKSPWGGRVSPVEGAKLISAASAAIEAVAKAGGPDLKNTVVNVWLRVLLALPQRSLSAERSVASSFSEGTAEAAKALWGDDLDSNGKAVPAEPQHEQNRKALKTLELRVKQLTGGA